MYVLYITGKPSKWHEWNKSLDIDPKLPTQSIVKVRQISRLFTFFADLPYFCTYITMWVEKSFLLYPFVVLFCIYQDLVEVLVDERKLFWFPLLLWLNFRIIFYTLVRLNDESFQHFYLNLKVCCQTLNL